MVFTIAAGQPFWIRCIQLKRERTNADRLYTSKERSSFCRNTVKRTRCQVSTHSSTVSVYPPNRSCKWINSILVSSTKSKNTLGSWQKIHFKVFAGDGGKRPLWIIRRKARQRNFDDQNILFSIYQVMKTGLKSSTILFSLIFQSI